MNRETWRREDVGLWMIAAAQVWTFATILVVADAANAGDMSEVRSGMYHKNVDKRLMLISGVGSI